MDNRIAYASGLVDGEGYIGIIKGSPRKDRKERCHRFEARLLITNTNSEVISWLVSNFGGTVSIKKRYSKKHKNALVWALTNNKLYPFLKSIHPYLIIKKKQAEIVLNFLDKKIDSRIGKNRVTDIELAFRTDSYEKLLDLNHRGPSPATTERDDSLIKEMPQSKLTQMINRESEGRSTLTA